MVSVVILMVIGLGIVGGIIWMRRRNWQAYATPDSPGVIPHETLALHAFAHGNTCLAAGQFAEAIAAFHQARELQARASPCRRPACRSGAAAAGGERTSARRHNCLTPHPRAIGVGVTARGPAGGTAPVVYLNHRMRQE